MYLTISAMIPYTGMITLLSSYIRNVLCSALGTLLARPGSNYPSMEDIEIEFTTYAIDFGKSLDDAARGYWVRGG